MSAHRILGAMVAGTALVILAAARPDNELDRDPPARQPEEPWLTPEAAAQIVGREGNLGPLFDGVELGGPAPSQAVRTRIAEFARANRVAIDLEVIGDELAAVRFAVTFGGCCGYEGADVLALRMRRPETHKCCGCEGTWIDDWATTTEDGVHMRARVRVNRVAVRWERTATLPQLVERADSLLGTHATTIGNAAGDRWIELEPDRRYLLEMPYPFVRFAAPRDELGVQVGVARGRIVEVAIPLQGFDEQKTSEMIATLQARWGRPRVVEDTRTWRTSDRIVTAELVWPTRITIRKR